MKKYGKFAALIVVVVGTLVWLMFTGAGESKTYYKTVAEVCQGPNQVLGKRIRVGGDVVDGSIQHIGNTTQFVLVWENQKLNVVYTGTDPLPDTFKSGAEALADGRLGPDQIFRASKVQAKCASKYESKPGMAPGQPAPNINTGKS